MITQQHRLLAFLMAAIGLATASVAQSKDDVEVNSANPESAVQGTFNLDVTIGGQGFDPSAEVRFLRTGSGKPVAGLVVNSTQFYDPNTLIANIDVSDTAEITDADIEVRLSRGRGGKGTTLFAVSAKKTVFNCFEAFGVSYPDACSCTFTVQDETNQSGFPPLWTWQMQDDCSTSETLILGQYEGLTSGTGGAELTAVAPFTGSTVVAAAGHRAKLWRFNIDIGNGVAAGCGPGELQSAIGFVLDGDSDYPEVQPFPPSVSYLKTLWHVWLNTISTDGPALCHAIELTRTQAYSDAWPAPLYSDFQAIVDNNVIMTGSYQQTGVLLRGFIPHTGSSSTSVGVSRNTIHPAAGQNANAVQVGPLFGPVEALRNMITLGGGTGVLAVGDGVSDVEITQNDVIGADIAVLVDYQVGDATFKSNILNGDGIPSSGDIGICSDAASEKFRANKFKQFDFKTEDDVPLNPGDCTILANPAN